MNWFPDVEKPSTPYNLSPYTPKDIKNALINKNLNSAPGYDGIVYEYLLKMPFLHQVMATVFTKIRDKSEAPQEWAKSNMILIKKDSEESNDEPSHFRMIALTLNIGKLYHTLEAERALHYMLENKYLDCTAQKAYVDGINGCVEHVTIVQEVIQHARLNSKTLHCTWFDLMDAFGSVPHALIPYVMKYYNFPNHIIKYITSLYSKLEGKVLTKDWESEPFKFLRGVFQGDPYSGIIFLIIFNPLVEFIKMHIQTHGYEVTTVTKGVKPVITTPFADDFNIITRDKIMHQKLVTSVEEKLFTMGLVIKPKKCRSLSIEKGKPEKIKFVLNGIENKVTEVDSVLEKPLKFLGSLVEGICKPSAMFAAIMSKLETKLQNIDKSLLRGEYKLNIYSRYALPSMRYFLSVHQLHATHMQQIDFIAKKYIKRWMGIQKHGVTDASIFHPLMLGIHMPSQTYKEAHASNYAMTRLKGDTVVNHVVDSRLERESKWSKKYSTTVAVHNMWKDNIKNNKIKETQENYSPSFKEIESAKKAIQKSVQTETHNTWNERIRKLTFQGDFVQLLIEEQENVSWKSICNNIPKGVLSFALKSSTNGLNTPDNLKRWGIRKMDKCGLCKNRGTLEHTLNYCSVALNQGRFTWRHDSVLAYFTSELKRYKSNSV